MRSPLATRRRLVFSSGIGPAFFIACLGLYRPAFFTRLDDAVYDSLIRSIRTKPPSPHIAIVDVDERSLATIGQWPWRRDQIARLISRIRDLGASTVALDVIFAEPDRGGFPNADEDSVHRPLSTPDEVLAATLREGRVVLGYAMTFDAGPPPPTKCVIHPVGLAMIGTGESTGESPLFRATSAVCSLPALGDAARASGFLNAAPDADGILRRAPLVVELDGRVYPALALAALAATTGTRDVALRTSNPNASSLLVDQRNVPLDGKGNLLLRYRGKKRTFPYVSAADILGGGAPDGAFRDKIVFVGTTALGTREVVSTPLDTLFAGVEVQATVADNLLQQDFIIRSPLGTIVESLASIALGGLIALLATRASLATGVVTGVGVAVAFWLGAAWQLSSSGAFVSPLVPSAAVLSSVACMTFAKLTVERRRADTATRDRTNAQRLMVQSLLSLTETRDLETGRHSRRTQRYARLLAEQLATHPDFHDYLTPERIELMSSLAPLHDIGKVGVPDHILNKPGALTDHELEQMRKHPVLGRDAILRAEQQVGVRDDLTLAMAKDIVYTHHERWDGTGYPQGLRGREIPIAGRVMAIVDVYDAAVTRALYRQPISHEDAVKFIVARKGSHFDPVVVDAFVSVAPMLRDVTG